MTSGSAIDGLCRGRRLTAIKQALWLMVSGTVLCASSGHIACAQPSRDLLSEYTLKAVYLYNFSRFVTWPAAAFDNADSPFVIGVVGEVPNDLDTAMRFYARAKEVQGRRIEYRRLERTTGAVDCHILLIPGTISKERAASYVEACGEKSVLLVGEADEFLAGGGCVRFFLAEAKVKFQVSRSETLQRQLRMDARLLKIAEVVE